jgi:hypothetical protein
LGRLFEFRRCRRILFAKRMKMHRSCAGKGSQNVIFLINSFMLLGCKTVRSRKGSDADESSKGM